MKWEEAQAAAVVTESMYDGAIQRISSPEIMRLLHAAIGLCTETGEIQDALKRHIFYGAPLDRVNLMEEGGDVSWYLRLLAEGLRDLAGDRCSFEEMIRRNIEKLRIRYPDKFNEAAALNRDLTREREVLTGD